MTVILVLMTIAIFLTIDYVRSRKRIPQSEAQQIKATPAITRTQAPYVSGFHLPQYVQYHPGHTWALRESPTLVRVGIDDFAARLIGNMESVLLPKRGQWIRQGQKVFTMLKDGRRAELVSPIEGEITDVNQAVLKDARLLNNDPYGEGWLLTVMSPDAQTNFRNLLSDTFARQWMTETANRLRAVLSPAACALAQDGGIAMRDLSTEIPADKWNELTREFFLT